MSASVSVGSECLPPVAALSLSGNPAPTSLPLVRALHFVCVLGIVAMSSIFEGYDNDYQEISGRISRNLNGVSGLDPEERRSRLAEIDSELAEAEALIRRMDLEARSTQGSARQELQQRLKERKDDLQRLKKAAKDASKGPQAAQTDRQALLSSGPLSDEEAPTSSSQRENMLSATERIRKTGDKIQHGKKQLLESEELGANILQDLHRQRETITHARDTLYSTDETIGRSRKILSAMARRAVQNKLILGVVGVILLVAIILVIYFKS